VTDDTTHLQDPKRPKWKRPEGSETTTLMVETRSDGRVYMTNHGVTFSMPPDGADKLSVALMAGARAARRGE